MKTWFDEATQGFYEGKLVFISDHSAGKQDMRLIPADRENLDEIHSFSSFGTVQIGSVGIFDAGIGVVNHKMFIYTAHIKIENSFVHLFLNPGAPFIPFKNYENLLRVIDGPESNWFPFIIRVKLPLIRIEIERTIDSIEERTGPNIIRCL